LLLLLVEPTVAWWVQLVQLGQHGPHGFVGEVVHQLLQPQTPKGNFSSEKKKRSAESKRLEFLRIEMNQTNLVSENQNKSYVFPSISLLRFKNITMLSLHLACRSAQLMTKKCRKGTRKSIPSNQQS
jgi:hypothetical protein